MAQREHTDNDDRLRAERMIEYLREKSKQLRQQAMMTPEEVAQAFREDRGEAEPGQPPPQPAE